jgi:hypothetical protein
VTPSDCDSVDRLPPQLVGKLAQLAFFKLPKITWNFDEIEQRGLGLNGHANVPSY